MNKYTVLEQLERELVSSQLDKVSSLSEMEQKLRQILQVVGNVLLHLWIMWHRPRYNAPTTKCVPCGGEKHSISAKEAVSCIPCLAKFIIDARIIYV